MPVKNLAQSLKEKGLNVRFPGPVRKKKKKKSDSYRITKGIIKIR